MRRRLSILLLSATVVSEIGASCQAPSAQSVAEASTTLSEELEPQEDQQATPAMRRHLAKELLLRCVSTLLSRPDLRTGAPA